MMYARIDDLIGTNLKLPRRISCPQFTMLILRWSVDGAFGTILTWCTSIISESEDNSCSLVSINGFSLLRIMIPHQWPISTSPQVTWPCMTEICKGYIIANHSYAYFLLLQRLPYWSHRWNGSGVMMKTWPYFTIFHHFTKIWW